MSALSAAQLVRALVAVRDAVEAHRAELNRLDAEIGDGDHGTGLHAGFQAAVKRLDFKLFDDAETFLRLVRYRPGLIEFTPAPGAPQDLAGRLAQMLRTATGERWAVTVSNDAGQPSIAEARRAAEDAARRAARDHPLVARALAIFPGAEVTEVRPLAAPAAPDYLPAIPDPEDETPDDDADLLDTDDPFHDDGT